MNGTGSGFSNSFWMTSYSMLWRWQKCLKVGFGGSSEFIRVTVKLDIKNSGLGKANKYTEKGIKVGRRERLSTKNESTIFVFCGLAESNF